MISDILQNKSFLKDVLELCAAESKGSDSAGRNGINVELQLVKSWNARKEELLLLTQRQFEENLKCGRWKGVLVESEQVAPEHVLHRIKVDLAFDAVDLFAIKRTETEGVVKLIDWCSLKTAQIVAPKKKSVKHSGAMLTVFNDANGEIADYFLQRPHNIVPEHKICKVFYIVLFRNNEGENEAFSVFTINASPRELLQLYPVKMTNKAALCESKEDAENGKFTLSFVDRQRVSNAKATSFNRGVKIRLHTLFQGNECFETLVNYSNLSTSNISNIYNEMYGLSNLP